MNPKGKTALITGGAIRVGKAITLGLARAGANVAINYNHDAEQAAQTAKEAEGMGVTALTLQANIADWEQVQRMFSQVHEKIGTVDILVNNASVWKQTPFPTDSIEDWHTVTGVVINGAFYVSNLAAKDMLEKKQGVIINIVDISVWEAWPKFAAHVIGKSALMAMTRQFALDLAPYVRVNAVCPGPVLPPHDYSPEKIKRTAAKTLLDRWGIPEDISKAVNFLIESDYINAESITVDGGQRGGERFGRHT
ncbi:MAG: SDR family oxidoreductase [Chloroflexi bacterium]|nr:SDR family oxidoreductase [Chloroflexota bacterium]